MRNSVAEPEHQICTQTRNKTILSDMHVHPRAYSQTHTHTQQSSRELKTDGCGCSREIKDLVLNIINGMKENQCLLTQQNVKTKVTRILPQSSGKWLRVLIMVQQLWSSRRFVPMIAIQLLFFFTAQHCHIFFPSFPSTCLWCPSSQPASLAHPSTQQALSLLLCLCWCTVLLCIWKMNVGKKVETTKRKVFVSKFSYWALAGWAMGQRAVRPKLQRQYIMPLESNQLSEMGS